VILLKVKLLRVTDDGVNLVANSARVSGVPESMDEKSIVRMIVENDYSSALEHIVFTFDISDISIAISRELLEHRIASHTARSTRYNIEEGFGFVNPLEYIPEIETIAGKDAEKEFLKAMEDARKHYIRIYRILEKYSSSIAKEVARYVLPVAAHTHYVWTVNARSLINFLMLRLCVRAAPEMRELAKKIREIVVEIYPEIFSGIGCRGYTLGICPENEARPKNCPYRKLIKTKKEVKKQTKIRDISKDLHHYL
jgi:thymidylate synthase (FAD)